MGSPVLESEQNEGDRQRQSRNWFRLEGSASAETSDAQTKSNPADTAAQVRQQAGRALATEALNLMMPRAGDNTPVMRGSLTDGQSAGFTIPVTDGRTVVGTVLLADGRIAGGTVPVTDGRIAGGTVPVTDGRIAGGTVPVTDGRIAGGTVPVTDGRIAGGTVPVTDGRMTGGTFPVTDGRIAGGTVPVTDGRMTVAADVRTTTGTAGSATAVGDTPRILGAGAARPSGELLLARAEVNPGMGGDAQGGEVRQFTKPDGTHLEYHGNLVSLSTYRGARIEYQYEQDANGVMRDARGKPILRSLHIIDGGRELTLDNTNCTNLQDRVSIAQSGPRAGNIEIKSADGLQTTYMTTDFSVYRFGDIQGADGKVHSKMLAVEKNDRSGRHGVALSWDPNNPELLRGLRETTAQGTNTWEYSKDAKHHDFARIIEQQVGDTTRRLQYDSPTTNRCSVLTETTKQADGSVHVDTWRRQGNSDKFQVTKWDGTTQIRDMSARSEAEHKQHIVFKTLERHWFKTEGPAADGKDVVERARNRFLKAAEREHLFGGDRSKTRDFVAQFEGRIHDDRNNRIAAPSDDQIARTYNYLCKMLGYENDHGRLDMANVHRHKTNMGERNKQLACATALMAVADPLRYVNQANKGTCELAGGVQSVVIHDNPDQYVRIVNSCLDGRVVSRDRQNGVNLNTRQLTPENRYGETYANQLFAAFAVTVVNYKLYTDTGDSLPGASEIEAKKVWHFATGKDTLFIAGRGTPASRVRDWIRRHGAVMYYCPDKNHCESIIGLTKNGSFIKNNSWDMGAVVHSDGTPVTNKPLCAEDGVFSASQLLFS